MKPETWIDRQRISLFNQLYSDNLNIDQVIDKGRFQRAISLEKKRSERSGIPWLLMRMDVRKFHLTSERKAVLQKFFSVLDTNIRTTDIRGWIISNAVVGVLFTEFGESDPIEARNKISEKIRKALEKKLSQAQIEKITLSYELMEQQNNKSIEMEIYLCPDSLKLPVTESTHC